MQEISKVCVCMRTGLKSGHLICHPIFYLSLFILLYIIICLFVLVLLFSYYGFCASYFYLKSPSPSSPPSSPPSSMNHLVKILLFCHYNITITTTPYSIVLTEYYTMHSAPHHCHIYHSFTATMITALACSALCVHSFRSSTWMVTTSQDATGPSWAARR